MDNNNQANQPSNSLLRNTLGAIGSTEESTFSEICRGLGEDRPEKGDKRGWCDLFDTIRKAENDGLVEISYGRAGEIEGAILTEAGVAELRRLREQSNEKSKK